MALENIQTIVLLMYENRSFDHMLGHLSYDNIKPGVNGLQSPLNQYQNIYQGDGGYNPFRMKTDVALDSDLPHEWNFIDMQLDKGPNGVFQMDGFVNAYLSSTGAAPNKKSPPMGYFDSDLVPITSFLANNFAVCDRWHAALPASTQPNRTMAFCGDSSIYVTKTQLISATGNIFDWMENHGVRWRVYHDGLSFFTFYNTLWHYMFTDHFQRYENLFRDFTTQADATFPQVVVVEPSYQDGPHIGPDHPNDNHPPLAIGFGEDFFRRTYQAVTANPDRWGNTLLIVYYDEHGGFFDHLPPPSMNYTTTGDDPHQFTSLGLRVPAILISPWVKKNSTTHLLFDHTSVLQLLAEKFTPGTPYSANVDFRKNNGIQSLSAVLEEISDPKVPAVPETAIQTSSALGDNIAVAPTGAQAQAFEQVTRQMMDQHPAEVALQYPELLQWRDAVDKARLVPVTVANG